MAMLYRDWLIVVLVVGLFLSLGAVSYLKSQKFDYSQEIQMKNELLSANVRVTVNGAVENPGIYIFEKGATIKDLFTKAKPLKIADTKRWRLNKKLWDGMTVDVDEKKKV